jgi:hypothetical protein
VQQVRPEQRALLADLVRQEQPVQPEQQDLLGLLVLRALQAQQVLLGQLAQQAQQVRRAQLVLMLQAMSLDRGLAPTMQLRGLIQRPASCFKIL